MTKSAKQIEMKFQWDQYVALTRWMQHCRSSWRYLTAEGKQVEYTLIHHAPSLAGSSCTRSKPSHGALWKSRKRLSRQCKIWGSDEPSRSQSSSQATAHYSLFRFCKVFLARLFRPLEGSQFLESSHRGGSTPKSMYWRHQQLSLVIRRLKKATTEYLRWEPCKLSHHIKVKKHMN